MINLLRERRSIRKFQRKSVSSDSLKILEEAMLRCPTSRDFRPWQFIFVDNREMLQKLSLAKIKGSAFLANAPLGVIICGDESKSDVWIEDCSIAAITLQYTAFSIGLASCWIQIRNRQHNETQTSENFIQKMLHIAANLRVDAIIAIGFAAEQKPGRPASLLAVDKIHYNQFPDKGRK